METKKKKILIGLLLISFVLTGLIVVKFVQSRPGSLENFTDTPRSEFDDILDPLFEEPLPKISTEFGIAYTPIGSNQTHNFSKTHLSKLNTSIIRFSVHWEYIEPTY
ncbi:MAG: hypothetical protein BAJALOKI2v1_110058 [Promethearchaeota archaeon]|nr:MAG: hypothetical protein BAJALOKI2v1_110058 [Candidatus Lokiarchaeota archaeon]